MDVIIEKRGVTLQNTNITCKVKNNLKRFSGLDGPNRQSLVFSERGQLSQAIPQVYFARILHQRTPIARFESQCNERRVYEDQSLCFQEEIWPPTNASDSNRCDTILASDSAITLVRFRPAIRLGPFPHGWPTWRPADQHTTRRSTWTWCLLKAYNTRNPCGSACCGLVCRSPCGSPMLSGPCGWEFNRGRGRGWESQPLWRFLFRACFKGF